MSFFHVIHIDHIIKYRVLLLMACAKIRTQIIQNMRCPHSSPSGLYGQFLRMEKRCLFKMGGFVHYKHNSTILLWRHL